MKAVLAFTLLITTLLAAPAEYGPPPGGWNSIDWTKVTYPPGTGANPTGVDWTKVNYPPGTGAGASPCPPCKRDASPAPVEYGPPPGGWGSIDWTKVTYPPGTGAAAGAAANACKC